jgi:hypothetical protein
MRSKSETDENLILQIEELICPSAPRRYRRRELAAATHGFAEAEKIGRGGFGAVYRGFLADQERHVAIKVLSSSLQAQAKGMREFQAEVKVKVSPATPPAPLRQQRRPRRIRREGRRDPRSPTPRPVGLNWTT